MKKKIIILSVIVSSIILILGLLFAFTIRKDNKCISKIVMMNYSEEPNLEQLFSWYNLKEQDIEYYQKGYDESTCHFGPGDSCQVQLSMRSLYLGTLTNGIQLMK